MLNLKFISQGVVPAANVTAFLGLHDLANPHSSGYFRRFPVSRIIEAPNKQDVALIKVDGEIDIRSGHISTFW